MWPATVQWPDTLVMKGGGWYWPNFSAVDPLLLPIELAGLKIQLKFASGNYHFLCKKGLLPATLEYARPKSSGFPRSAPDGLLAVKYPIILEGSSF